ncbi:hypothetical protein [Novipirellula galeiformis]|uniref:hypothetical protein n=1 Tax=Novipirellula galeiformis TaxID=2528004 RepID=UPI0018CDA427|nr:hypothetical protein [Novipirellula galeiformis]
MQARPGLAGLSLRSVNQRREWQAVAENRKWWWLVRRRFWRVSAVPLPTGQAGRD